VSEFPIPDGLTRVQRIIVRSYIVHRSVPKVARELEYKTPSFVRKVVRDYKLFLADYSSSR